MTVIVPDLGRPCLVGCLAPLGRTSRQFTSVQEPDEGGKALYGLFRQQSSLSPARQIMACLIHVLIVDHPHGVDGIDMMKNASSVLGRG